MEIWQEDFYDTRPSQARRLSEAEVRKFGVEHPANPPRKIPALEFSTFNFLPSDEDDDGFTMPDLG